MKKFLLPVALFAAFALTACGDEPLDSACEQADKTKSCDITKAEICSDEETEEVYYTYNGKKYTDVDELISVLCPNATEMDRYEIRKSLSAQGKRLLDRIRVNAIRAI
ncbi:MAG: hypothetical protein J6X32_00300 [Salinivirgaceae bacterium]|nr:hypothetical protein [Salinivirgaceae bacterium]